MISIFDMTLSDLELIQDNLIKEFDDFWKPETLRNELINENSRYIISKNDKDEILGFAGIWKSVDDVHITNVVVKKDIRHQGIGSLLLEKLIEIVKNYNLNADDYWSPIHNKINSITLEVNCKNTPAIELYSKYGFEKVGTRKKYYKGIEDAFIMTLNL